MSEVFESRYVRTRKYKQQRKIKRFDAPDKRKKNTHTQNEMQFYPVCFFIGRPIESRRAHHRDSESERRNHLMTVLPCIQKEKKTHTHSFIYYFHLYEYMNDEKHAIDIKNASNRRLNATVYQFHFSCDVTISLFPSSCVSYIAVFEFSCH